MLKGWIDRLLMPGVAFDLSNPHIAVPLLRQFEAHRRNHDLRPAVVERAARRRSAAQDGDALSAAVHRRRAHVDYYALYHMNVATDETRNAFMAKVRAAMARF